MSDSFNSMCNDVWKNATFIYNENITRKFKKMKDKIMFLRKDFINKESVSSITVNYKLTINYFTSDYSAWKN